MSMGSEFTSQIDEAISASTLGNDIVRRQFHDIETGFPGFPGMRYDRFWLVIGQDKQGDYHFKIRDMFPMGRRRKSKFSGWRRIPDYMKTSHLSMESIAQEMEEYIREHHLSG